REGRLVTATAAALNYATNFPAGTGLVQMLKQIGESCAESVKAKKLFAGMVLSNDYRRVATYLMDGWRGRK
ncbi:MAG: hypothetical protein ACREDR_15575, partial [Blastocatellia bacterium]